MILSWLVVCVAALALIVQPAYSGAVLSRRKTILRRGILDRLSVYSILLPENSFNDRNRDGDDRGVERPLPVDPDLMALRYEYALCSLRCHMRNSNVTYYVI